MNKPILLCCFILSIACQSSSRNSLAGEYSTYFPRPLAHKALELEYNATVMGGGKLVLLEDSSFSLSYPAYSYSGTWRADKDSLHIHSRHKEYAKQFSERASEEQNKMMTYGIDGDLLLRHIASPEKRSLEILKKVD